MGPAVFGASIATGSRGEVLWGHLPGTGLMLAGAAVVAALVALADRRLLERVAPPLLAA